MEWHALGGGMFWEVWSGGSEKDGVSGYPDPVCSCLFVFI